MQNKNKLQHLLDANSVAHERRHTILPDFYFLGSVVQVSGWQRFQKIERKNREI